MKLFKILLDQHFNMCRMCASVTSLKSNIDSFVSCLLLFWLVWLKICQFKKFFFQGPEKKKHLALISFSIFLCILVHWLLLQYVFHPFYFLTYSALCLLLISQFLKVEIKVIDFIHLSFSTERLTLYIPFYCLNFIYKLHVYLFTYILICCTFICI